MIVWAAALFTQSSIPGDSIPDLGILTHDKIIHFCIYVIFTATVNRAMRNQKRYPLFASHHYVFTFILVAIFAASDEFHQYFVPKRSCDFFDWLADSAGAMLYIVFHWVRGRYKTAVASA